VPVCVCLWGAGGGGGASRPKCVLGGELQDEVCGVKREVGRGSSGALYWCAWRTQQLLCRRETRLTRVLPAIVVVLRPDGF